MEASNSPVSASPDAATQNKPTNADLLKVWAELNRDTEGVSLTVYEEYEGGQVAVRDESWWTWAEFTGMSDENLDITETGSVEMNAIQQDTILTADNILDTVFGADLSLVDFGNPIGSIGNEPVFDEMEIPSEEDTKARLSKEL